MPREQTTTTTAAAAASVEVEAEAEVEVEVEAAAADERHVGHIESWAEAQEEVVRPL